MFLAESNVGHKICRPHDLVINTLWAWMAALGVSRLTGLVSPAYGVYRPLMPDRVLPRFADFLLRTPAYAAEYLRRSTGVNSSRLRLYPEDFLRIHVLLPCVYDRARQGPEACDYRALRRRRPAVQAVSGQRVLPPLADRHDLWANLRGVISRTMRTCRFKECRQVRVYDRSSVRKDAPARLVTSSARTSKKSSRSAQRNTSSATRMGDERTAELVR